MKPNKLIATLMAVLYVSLFARCHAKELDNGFVRFGEFHGNELDKKVNCVLDNVDLWGFMIGQPRNCILPRRLAIGAELSFSLAETYHKKTVRFSVNISSMSKREILNEIVRHNPGYSWEEKDKVVNIQPYKVDKDSATSSLLDRTIPSFEVNKISIPLAANYLLRLANENGIPLTTMERERALKEGVPLLDSGKAEDLKPYSPSELITVSIGRRVSIRDCLNAIVAANPPASWLTVKYGDMILVDVHDPKFYSDSPIPKTTSTPILRADGTEGFSFSDDSKKAKKK